MATEQPVPDWHVEPALCRNCAPHDWHGTECRYCPCETSCLAQVVIVPRDVPPNVLLGEN